MPKNSVAGKPTTAKIQHNETQLVSLRESLSERGSETGGSALTVASDEREARVSARRSERSRTAENEQFQNTMNLIKY